MRKGIKAGDRVPDLRLSSSLEPSTSIRLHQLLSIEHFTLLLVNMKPSDPVYSNIEAELVPWKRRLTIKSILPHSSDEQPYSDMFDDDAGLYLVRPDGYLAFSGSNDSLEELKSYLKTWLSLEKSSYTELSLI